MTSLLILAFIAATSSSVFAVDYFDQIHCDAEANHYDVQYRYCPLNYKIGPKDLGYYELDLLEDYSLLDERACQHHSYYKLELYNNTPSIRVENMCNGLFGLRVKVAGYPYKGVCGQDNKPALKIRSGKWTDDCKFPWMAAVNKNWKSRNEGSACGGSIIDKSWILTAAHCVVSQYGDGFMPPADAFYVRTGSKSKWYNYIYREVTEVYVHPEYEYIRLFNDIALLKLKEPIKYDGCHSPVCLNTNKTIAVNKQCIVSGWGATGINPIQYSREMRHGFDNMLSPAKCKKIYGIYSKAGTICGGKSPFCSGDSGGPLVCKDDNNGRYYQHGIVSLYLSNRNCRMEGLYSSVAYYHDWIMSHVKPRN